MISYIHEYAETDISLQEAAEMFQLSPSQLSKMFKEETNTNFVNYLINHRMTKAKEWLIHTDMSVKKIAERLRYTSPQNFSRIFKQKTGVSPSLYRDNFLQNDPGLAKHNPLVPYESEQPG